MVEPPACHAGDLASSSLVIPAIFARIATMPYANREDKREAQRRWYIAVVIPRRQKWLKDNGPCSRCGLWKDLTVDHKDRNKKVDHRVWTWAEQRRAKELEKCQVLCSDCHKLKSAEESKEWNGKRRIIGEGDLAWCYSGQHFTDKSNFSFNRSNWDGLEDDCKYCRRTRRNKLQAIRSAARTAVSKTANVGSNPASPAKWSEVDIGTPPALRLGG